MVDAVEARWREPDHGIWELRARPRHHVHSKTMCWMTVNKAIEVGDLLMGEHPLEWETLADTIRDDVLANGVDPERGIFTAAYGADDLDAASLWVGLSGMVAPDDPRFVRTVDAVDQALGAGPVTWRYRHDDGLPGVEGAFLICGSWMIDSLYLIGRVAEAERRFDRLCALAGPTGMMSEQYDPDEDVALGNVPQAYSHLGLIDNALRLAGRLSPH
jgi:GH15 family glucan-1,4-alpha-glucosidase